MKRWLHYTTEMSCNFEFKNTVDMMGSEDFCQFLRDDEE
ncbi:hypothetical protein C790_03310 [Morganella morganii SC01]|nr:hypothetical protein C790_03310 [Morganella morganii SC01]